MRIIDWSSDVCSSDLSFARQPFGIVERREIAKPAVAQDGCNALARAELAGERHRAGDVDPRRQAKAQPLLVEQAAHDRQPLGVGDAELGVDRDRKSVVSGTSGAVRVDLGGSRNLKQKKK